MHFSLLCIAGDHLTVVFENYEPPINPNKRINFISTKSEKTK